MEMKNATAMARYVMLMHPEAKDSDNELIVQYLREMGIDINQPFSAVIRGPHPSFETITRARRRVQELDAMFASCEAVTNAREEREREIREWAVGNG